MFKILIDSIRFSVSQSYCFEGQSCKPEVKQIRAMESGEHANSSSGLGPASLMIDSASITNADYHELVVHLDGYIHVQESCSQASK